MELMGKDLCLKGKGWRVRTLKKPLLRVTSWDIQLLRRKPHMRIQEPHDSLQEAYFKKVEVHFSWIITLLMGLMNHFWQN